MAMKTIAFKVDKELHKRMKMLSIIEGIALQEWVARALLKSLNERSKKNAKTI